MNTKRTPQDSIIMLVDHQTGTLGWVKSIPQQTLVASCRVLARMATGFEIPLILTTTMEEQVGPSIEDLQQLAPRSLCGAICARRAARLLGRRAAEGGCRGTR